MTAPATPSGAALDALRERAKAVIDALTASADAWRRYPNSGAYEVAAKRATDARQAFLAECQPLVILALLTEHTALRAENRVLMETEDAARSGLREPCTLEDAWRVRTMLTHQHVERTKAKVLAERAAMRPGIEEPR